MSKNIYLEKIVNKLDFSLPVELEELDCSAFGMDYTLYDYQNNALRNIIKLLWEYYVNLKGEKKGLLNKYREVGFDENLEKTLNITRKNENFDFLSKYYEICENRLIKFENIVNRAGFWMATGSGKTFIMIKLIEILFKMWQLGYIPQKDILILAPKDAILEQIKKHIDEFNRGNEIKIDFKDLRQFEREKQQKLDLFSSKNRINVFYYRADNIREENKDILVDYKTYLNDGNWYLILDEAHKGDKEFSKAQQYYNVLSKNGFLFNFSATFVDELDIATTVYNFNLERFISSGYGKHIKLTNQEYKSFKKKVDSEFGDDERQKIVLKSLVTFAAIKKAKEEINKIDSNLFHNPLMITVANSVNTMDADLKVFFVELSKIAQGQGEIESIKAELISDFKDNPDYYFNYGEKISYNFIDIINNLQKEDIAKLIFNSDSFGSIEIVTIANNPKEIAFKLTTSNTPFALLYASDVIKWTDNVLSGYSHSKDIISETFFEDINSKSNPINILMGSRIFIEGWDCNRPNVINFINLGVNDARKLVLQTIGRGVRINPYKKEIRRIENIKYKINNLEGIIKYTQPVQSLFLFSTNKETIGGIIENLDCGNLDEWVSIKGFRKNLNINKKLLKPVIEACDAVENRKYKISQKDFFEIDGYLTEVNSKIAFIEEKISIDTIDRIKNKKDSSFEFNNILFKDSIENNLLKINRFFKTKSYSLKEYSYVENDDIQSYRKIQIKNIPLAELNKLEEQIKNSIENKNVSIEELVFKLQNKQITTEEFIQKQSVAQNSSISYEKIDPNLSKIIQEHYYNPIIVAKRGFEDFFKNVIQEPSEIEFIKELLEYKNKSENLKKYDWWYFSKLVENVDNIKMPYYNSIEEKINEFYPDFVFWLKKDNRYYIKFIDPKGIEHPRNAVDKINSFNKIFNSNQMFEEKFEVITQLYYYNQNEPSVLKNELSKYWTNDFDYIFGLE